MGLLDYCLVIKAPFRIPDTTKEGIVRWWPRITTVVLVIVLLLVPFLKIWLNLAEFGASFGGAGETATFHYAEIALDHYPLTNSRARTSSDARAKKRLVLSAMQPKRWPDVHRRGWPNGPLSSQIRLNLERALARSLRG